MYRSNIWELFVDYTEEGQIVSDIGHVIGSSWELWATVYVGHLQGISSSLSGSLGKAEIMNFSLISFFSV